jgi:hypothetical protein
MRMTLLLRRLRFWYRVETWHTAPEPALKAPFMAGSASPRHGRGMRNAILLAVLALGLLAAPAPTLAQEAQRRARDAVEAGELRPLGEVLARIGSAYPGRVIDVRLDRRGGATWLYLVKLLTPGGRVLAITVDARTGAIVAVRGAGR